MVGSISIDQNFPSRTSKCVGFPSVLPPVCRTTGGSGAQVTNLEFKFSHQCTEWEPLAGNHFYEINLDSVPAGVDTFDVNWADQAPEDFTDIAVDVIFRVQAPASGPPFATGDSLGIGGAELPLDWNAILSGITNSSTTSNKEESNG